MTNKTLVIITGPTAVGKTALSIRIARELATEIISADARQFYKELQIGTASPTPEEQKHVRHHLINHLSIYDYYNAAMFEQQALEIMYDLFQRSDYVVVTGGSGLYIDTLCHGIDELPDPDPAIRRQVKDLYEREGLTGLRHRLKQVDPQYHSEVDPANHKRIMRALEVFMSTGIPASYLRKNQRKERPFNIKKIVLNRPRQELFASINQRVDHMIRMGLIEEALGLFKERHLNALNTVGYKELYAWLANRWPLTVAVDKIKTNTRRYAKRQLTWFRRYEDARWYHPGEEQAVMDFILYGNE